MNTIKTCPITGKASDFEIHGRETEHQIILLASVQQIVALLSLSFGRLILISFLLAAPLAVRWYLQQYAYKVDINLWLYLHAGLFASVLAAVTLGYQSIRATRKHTLHQPVIPRMDDDYGEWAMKRLR